MTSFRLAIYTKIFVGILMPVFLSGFFPTPSFAQTQDLIPVVFQINNSASAPAVFESYGFDASQVMPAAQQPEFRNIYKATATSESLRQMNLDPAIAYAQQDFRLNSSLITTTDPFFTENPLNEDKQWYLAKTQIISAWDYTKGSSNIVVAIIDTGIHASHIELNDGRIIAGYNTITNQPIPTESNSDDNGHGTAVAGILGAISNNAKGLAGINWNIQIMPIKALIADGTGDSSNVAAGIIWAADHGANIINLSLGGSGFSLSKVLSDSIAYAYNKGVLVVAAVGNDTAEHGLNLDQSAVYPVCADNGLNMVLGVAATDINDRKADFSNFGFNCVDIAAPGKRILTTAYFPTDPSNNVLIYGSGTSLATPIVAGIAALIKANYPNYSNVEIANAIKNTAENIDIHNQNNCLGTSCNGFLGKGRINAQKAIEPKPIQNGSLVRESSTGNVYLISNYTKRLVSDFVLKQRGLNPSSVINETNGQLIYYKTASALPPLDGTLLKFPDSPQVYIINQELKRPVTYLVFISRGLKFSDILTISQTELDIYTLGDWYWPPDGTMVLIKGNPTVYVMDQQVRRPVTFFVFNQRQLSFKKVISVSEDEFSHIPAAPDLYWLAPLDGTLIKSADEAGIYVVENGSRHLLSFQAFNNRGYKFSNVKTLPQVEVDVIAPGNPIL